MLCGKFMKKLTGDFYKQHIVPFMYLHVGIGFTRI